MSTVINFYAGPGAGKSTTAANLFSLLKYDGINCELVTEYAKDKVWEDSLRVLENQIYVFGKQQHRLWKLMNEVDYIITDAPLLMSLYYGKHCSLSFQTLVVEEYSKMKNLDIFLCRKKEYQPKGRLQTEEQAKIIDTKIKEILDVHARGYHTFPGDRETPEKIREYIQSIQQKVS